MAENIEKNARRPNIRTMLVDQSASKVEQTILQSSANMQIGGAALDEIIEETRHRKTQFQGRR
jgi:hypothetical protein